MELRFIEQKNLNGISVRTNNSTEMTPNKGVIPDLWQTFDSIVPVDYKNGERVYGVYSNYESDHTGEFTVSACFDGKNFPSLANLKQITIPAGKYLVFSHQGDMPQIAVDAWTEVWQYFADKKTNYERTYTTDFEYYPNGNEIEVHIAIQ